jgi:hypothetical protein
MVRVVRTPEIFKEKFSPEQLNGWPSGFSFSPRRKRKRRQEPTNSAPLPKTKKVKIGVRVA